MAFNVEILADSLAPNGVRLTTLAITYPRIIHAEMLRHRVFSRCAASSRAIPVQKFLDQVLLDPYIPTYWGANQPGMSASVELEGEEREKAIVAWLNARDHAATCASDLMKLGIHKQTANRLIEPFQWMTEVLSGTEWNNFFHLRDHVAAHPDIQTIAQMMQEKIYANFPRKLIEGEWHLPLVNSDTKIELANKVSINTNMGVGRDVLNDMLIQVSAGRVARVSYLKHEDESDVMKDFDRAQKMLKYGHLSPFEHVARPMRQEEANNWLCNVNNRSPSNSWAGNFRGWIQYRKFINNEHDVLGHSKT